MKPIQFNQRRFVSEYFDKTARDYSQWYFDNSWLGYAFRIRKARVLELFDKPGGKVLDVGCGPGVMAMDLIERNCDFWGMDLSLEMVKQGRKKFESWKEVQFSTGSAESLSFAGNTFDAVISMGVIEFVDNDELALKEMVRVLQPGGTLVIAFPNKISPF